jgi:hypothetical protein
MTPDKINRAIAEALPNSIFELVDQTCDETYYCLGLYYTLEEALEVATSGSEPCTDVNDGPVTIEIRERAMGFSGWGNNGKAKAIVTWEQEYSEENDEYTWKHATELK